MAPVAVGDRVGDWSLALLPGAAFVFLAFNAGGFFPGTPALAAFVLLLVLISRIVVAKDPFAGFSPALGVAAGTLALYAAWTLLSATWSDSTSRALIEFDRALLYLVALVLYGSLPRDSWRIRWMTRGLALAIAVVCGVGLLTRLFPDVWPIAENLSENRLSYPITYWNTLGLSAAIGTILCFHFASSAREPRYLRLAGAAGVPLLCTTLYFTFSRGAILAGAIGLLAYIGLVRPRYLVSGALATIPPSVAAVAVAYGADRLAGQHPASTAATAQGHDVATVLLACILGALALRAGLLALDFVIEGIRPETRRRGLIAAAGAGIAAALLLVPVLGAPGYVSHQYSRFVHGTTVESPADQRARLTDPGNNGRIDHWRVAIDDGFDPSKLRGEGAGTYELVWAADRPEDVATITVHDAHSLYVESLSDLGLVGLGLVLTFVVTILFGFASGLGGAERALYGALLGAGLAWALEAGVDWQWEMPAVTLWFFALGGSALAAPGRARREPDSSWPLRAGVAIALGLVAIVPALITVSQGKLTNATQAFLRSGDCRKAIAEAQSAESVLAVRPDPYRIEGYCQLRLGEMAQGVASMRKAVDQDPDNWEFRYSLAVAKAAAGLDPRPAAREALRLDPLSPITRELVASLGTSDPQGWRRASRPLLRAPLL